MTIRRKSPTAFCDEETDIEKTICSQCYNDNEIVIFMLPYVMSNGKRDKGFMKCPECLRVVSLK